MEKVKVMIENHQREIKIPTGIRMLVRRCCTAVLTLEEFEGAAEVNVLFVDDEQIRELNLKHRHIDASTDVLSFPLGENGQYDVNPESGAKMLGEIVISLPHAIEQAREFDHTFQREVGYLTAHAMLHLLGYDHVGGGLMQVKMREKEEAVMELLGLSRSTRFIPIK